MAGKPQARRAHLSTSCPRIVHLATTASEPKCGRNALSGRRLSVEPGRLLALLGVKRSLVRIQLPRLPPYAVAKEQERVESRELTGITVPLLLMLTHSIASRAVYFPLTTFCC